MAKAQPVITVPSDHLPMVPDALDRLAEFYGDGLDDLRSKAGAAYLTPENVLMRALDCLLVTDGVRLHWCEAYGKQSRCHFWSQPHPGEGDFELRCGAHPERRTAERRRP